jgi:ribosomal protein S18 acetylase RimI-like enzyme
MEKPSFILRDMKLSDITSAMKLSNAEGWNQTENDWKLLVENAENICMVAESGNKVIGTTTAINYSNQVAWIGMVLVATEYRSMGISKSLLTNIFKRLEHVKSIKLDATPEGQQVYKKLDFKDEYLIVRMTNTSMKNIAMGDDDTQAEPVEFHHTREIIELDEFIFGANRKQLITFLVNEYPAKSWLLKRNNIIAGFVLGRDGNRYPQVGPVVASTTSDAKILIIKALNNLTNQSVLVDVLADKDWLLNWLHSIGFIKQRHFTRMYKNENLLPEITSKQYLIAGPEFG